MTETHPITTALCAAIRLSDRPMVLSDPHAMDHPLLAVNDAFLALSGYSAAETVGRNCRFMQGPETDPATASRIGRCLALRRGCVEWIVNYRRDGTTFWNLLFVSPVFDRDGTLLHFFGNQRDITEGRPAEVPDHAMGMADLSAADQAAFDKAVLDMLHDGPLATDDDAARARGLERVADAAQRMNAASMRLIPAPWGLPARG